MSDLRMLLERVGTDVTPRPDAFDRLVRHRQSRERRERATALVVALCVVGAGVAAGILAIRGTWHPRVSTSIGLTAPRGVLWVAEPPDSTRFCCLHAEGATITFARTVLGWEHPILRTCARPLEASCFPDGTDRQTYWLLRCPSCQPVVVHLEPVPSGWGVTDVTGAHLRFFVPPPGGTVLGGQALTVPTDLPDGTEVVVGYGYRVECGGLGFPQVAKVEGGSLRFRVGALDLLWHCGSGGGTNGVRSVDRPLSRSVDGYLFVLQAAVGRGALDPFFRAPPGERPPQLLDFAAVPVHFVPAPGGTS